MRRATPVTAAAVAVALAAAACSSSSSPHSAASPGAAVPSASGAAAGRDAPAGASGAAYVAMGDSYSAGIMIPDQNGTPKGCDRSDNDYPSLVARHLGQASFTDVTCGGATTDDLTSPQSTGNGVNAPQFDALGPGTKLVTLGIGGNDIGFASIVTTCITAHLGNATDAAPCAAKYTAGGTDQLRGRIDATSAKIGASLAEIHKRAPNARVLLVGYPAILPQDNTTTCSSRIPVAGGDIPYLRGVLQALDGMLAQQASANGATYVDTYTPGIGHDVCQATGTRWIEGIVPEQPAGPVHPNALGQQGMADAVVKALG